MGTGSFIVFAMFGPAQGVQFVRDFRVFVNAVRAHAMTACRDPLACLSEDIAEGKLRYTEWK